MNLGCTPPSERNRIKTEVKLLKVDISVVHTSHQRLTCDLTVIALSCVVAYAFCLGMACYSVQLSVSVRTFTA